MSLNNVAFKLNNGTLIPGVGLGTWQAEKGVVRDAVKTAIKAGYRHVDCASVYGNEQEVGDALQELFKSGIVRREDVWITSKLWCSDHDPVEVPKAIERTLNNLQLEYLDLYLIHWPAHLKNGLFLPLNIPATWAAMENLVDSGKTKAIGVSNFSCKKLGDLLATARITPAVNQVECHPLWHQKKLRDFCNSKGIHLSGYSPLGSTAKSVLADPVVNEVASRLGRTPAQVALRWGLQLGNSVLPKSTNDERIKSNFDVFDFSIPEEDLLKLASLPQSRVLLGNFLVNDTTSPYKSLTELWDGEI